MAVFRDVKVSTIAAMVYLAVVVKAGDSSHQEYVDPHNEARAAVGVAPLSWSADLASYAREYAGTQVVNQKCGSLTHSHGPYGENLFWGSGKAWTAVEAVTAWTDEITDYHLATNSCAPGKMCGHYTQVVWASTMQVGCASVVCNDGSDFIICSYDPPGNWIGERPY